MGENNAFQIQDTAYTKIFVGGLAWETRKDAVERYFEQFGEIQEAVVITDKATGRSKGYGFVTFSDPDSANRACQNPSPVIDGRRANCNLAFLGAQKPRSSTTQHVTGRYRGSPRMVVSPPKVYQCPSFSSSSSGYSHHQHTGHCILPYSSFGYPGYSQEALYPMNYYSVYGNQQYQPYYPSSSSGFIHNMYPMYAQGSQARLAPIPVPVQYPQMIHYLPQHYSSPGILPVPSSTTLSATSNTAVGSQITSERSSST